MSRFVLEVRRKDGKTYPPQNLYGVVCGLMRSVRDVNPSFNLFMNLAFHSFRQVLDGGKSKCTKLSAVNEEKENAPPFSSSHLPIINITGCSKINIRFNLKK